MIPEGSMIPRRIGEFREPPQVQDKVKRDLSFFTSSFGNPLSQNKNHSNSRDRFILQKKKKVMYVLLTLSIKYQYHPTEAVAIMLIKRCGTK